MSRRSTKNKEGNNLKTSYGRSVNERYSRAFNSAPAKSVTETVLLYKLVFMSKKAALLSVLLCLCFLTQPFQKAYADEPEVPTTPVVVVSQPPEVTQVTVPNENQAEISPPVPDVSPPETTVENNVTQSTEDNSAVVVVDSENDLTADESAQVASTSDSVTEEVDTETVSSSGGSDSGSTATSSEEDIAATDSVSDESASSTEEITEVVSDTSSSGEESEDIKSDNELPEENNGEFVSIVESDSQYSFNQNECTRIEDGSFYCQKLGSQIAVEDSLVALPDGDGDLEIFLVKDGVETQITHNLVDDASPFYDEYSSTIVWHRLVNDRYQIISYDIKTGKEQQLTDSNVNNMEPTRHGDYIVWQRWVKNNWEIILYENGVEKQITDSPRHDIAPHVRGPLIIWNSRSNDGTQSLMTYDIQSRTYTTIADGEGVSVSNPRMVVMYEAMYENGDVVMKGFDLVTGKIVPLESIPHQLPDEIPTSDSTGETRALIQPKPSTKSDVLSSATTTSSGNNDGNNGTTTDAISPELDTAHTLDLSVPTTTELTMVESTAIVASSTIPDLVIKPVLEETQSTSTQSGPE